MTQKYDDIINLHYPPTTQRHIRMSILSRAAQFAPFAALTGHAENIKECGRLTTEKINIDESMKTAINDKLVLLQNKIIEKPIITITFFFPDSKKAGGSYISVTGYIKKFFFDKTILMSNNDKIKINDIIHIDGNIFNQYNMN